MSPLRRQTAAFGLHAFFEPKAREEVEIELVDVNDAELNAETAIEASIDGATMDSSITSNVAIMDKHILADFPDSLNTGPLDPINVCSSPESPDTLLGSSTPPREATPTVRKRTTKKKTRAANKKRASTSAGAKRSASEMQGAADDADADADAQHAYSNTEADSDIKVHPEVDTTGEGYALAGDDCTTTLDEEP